MRYMSHNSYAYNFSASHIFKPGLQRHLGTWCDYFIFMSLNTRKITKYCKNKKQIKGEKYSEYTCTYYMYNK